MADAALRQRERDALQGLPGSKQALAAQRERMGLCPDCGGRHRAAATTGCEDKFGVAHFGDHAIGTRYREGGPRCPSCSRAAYARAKTLRGGGTPGATRLSRAVIHLAMTADPCPARRAKVLLAAKPFPPGKSGSGWCNANACWYAERKRAVDGYRRREYPPAAEDPRQQTLWGASG